MNLALAIEMYAGGPGSGCNPAAGKCGRPFGSGSGVIAKHNLQMAPANRKKWPEHIKHLVVPPAWTNVMYNPSPEGNLQVLGKDSKGRLQYIYSAKFLAGKAAAKFSRIEELQGKLDSISSQNEANRKSKDPKIRDAADVLAVIIHSGIRPGGEGDTGADKKAYGATTLQARHVKQSSNGEVKLLFVGKKGVKIDVPIEDDNLAKMLLDRKASVGEDTHGKIFPNIGRHGLLDYVKDLNGGGFSTKDFRTLIGTRVASEMVASIKKSPKDLKSYKKAVKKVAQKVAAKLGNTPSVALKSYISPVVFSKWKAKAGVV